MENFNGSPFVTTSPVTFRLCDSLAPRCDFSISKLSSETQ